MRTATIEQPKTEIRERRYLCGLSPFAPVAFLEVPVSRDVQDELDGTTRREWRAVQFAFQTTHYRGPDDSIGIPRFGRIETMTEGEVNQIWEFCKHRVVRWLGDEAKGQKAPEIEGRADHGYGPGGKHVTGKVFDKRDRRYVRNASDESLEIYVVLRPERAEDRGVTETSIPVRGGKEYFEEQLRAASERAAPLVADERAAYEQQIRELQAMLAAKKAEEAAVVSAEESEREESRDQKGSGRRRP